MSKVKAILEKLEEVNVERVVTGLIRVAGIVIVATVVGNTLIQEILIIIGLTIMLAGTESHIESEFEEEVEEVEEVEGYLYHFGNEWVLRDEPLELDKLDFNQRLRKKFGAMDKGEHKSKSIDDLFWDLEDKKIRVIVEKIETE